MRYAYAKKDKTDRLGLQQGRYVFPDDLCKGKEQIFSQVVGCGILDAPYVKLTDCGVCVQNALSFLAENNPDIHLEKWVIMPNHVHILLTIPVGKGASESPRPTNQVIPKFVSSLKRFTNRKTDADLWQIGYHDHIVRNEQDYLRIWEYIDNNPAKWMDDCYYIK